MDIGENFFPGAIFCLSVLISVICNCPINTVEEVDDFQSDGSINENKFVLRPRLYIWIRQMALTVLLTKLLVDNMSNLSFETLSDIDIDHIKFSIIFISFSIMLSLLMDGINNLHRFKSKVLWIVVYALSFSYFISMSVFDNSLSLEYFACYSVGFISTLIELIHNKSTAQSFEPTKEFTCNILEFLFYTYLNDILINPMQMKIMEFEDVPTFIDTDRAAYYFNKLGNVENHLTLELLKIVFWDWLTQGFFQLAGSTFNYLPTIALQVILSYVSDGNKVQRSNILPIDIHVNTAVFLLFFGPIVISLCEGQNYAVSKRIGMKVRGALITKVYEKVLYVDFSAYREGPGKVNNLISVDVRGIEEFASYSHLVWGTLYEIILSMAMLYGVLGNAALWGILVMGVFLVLGLVVSKKLESYQDEMFKNKDNRMSIVNELLNGIRIIKLFAWEENFLQRVFNSRKIEVGSLRRWAFTNVLSKIIWEVAPLAVACTAFMVYVYADGRVLTPSKGYASLTLFNALRFPLGVFPEMISIIVTAKLSLERIRKFLLTEDVKGLSSQFSEPSNIDRVIQVKDANFGWREARRNDGELASASLFDSMFIRYRNMVDFVKNVAGLEPSRGYRNVQSDENDDIEMSNVLDVSEHVKDRRNVSGGKPIHALDLDELSKSTTIPQSTSQVLAHLSLSVSRRSLVVVAGPTGCGKTTLLAGILGECQQTGGSVSIQPGTKISYVPQTSWIQNATFKENILFGNTFDEDRYNDVLDACALRDDLKLLGNGDETEIGEKGVNLSGGQQQRVSLGRASYSYSDIVILDDPLSAVDAHVGQHIFDKLICGFLNDRTRILVTHQIAIAVSKADILVCLDSYGNIVANCSPRNVKTSIFSNISYMSRQNSAEEEDSPDNFENAPKNKSTLRSSKSFAFLDTIINAVEAAGVTDQLDESQLSSKSFKTLRLKGSSEANHSIRITKSNESSGERQSNRGIVDKETKREGEVPLSIYWFYLQSCGGLISTSLMAAMTIGLIVSWTLQNWGLGVWMTSLRTKSKGSAALESLLVYLLSVGGVIALTVLRAILEAILNCRGAQCLHDAVMRRVVQAPSSWYDATPIGRIVNRLSQDISVIDKDVMQRLLSFFDSSCGIFQVITIVAITMPILLVPMIPIIFLAAFFANKFFRVSREIKRLESVNKSPVFVLFSESIHGVSVIRSYQNENRFLQMCFERVDNMNRCFLYMWYCNRWLNIRMQMMGAVVSGMVAFGIVLNVKNLTSSTAGLLLIYSIEFTNYLVYLARSHAEVQMNLNSVERIQEYSVIPIEKYSVHTQDNIIEARLQRKTFDSSSVIPIHPGVPNDWPSRGEIEYRHIFMKYASASDYVLRNVCFKAPAGKKVGIVGRTGYLKFIRDDNTLETVYIYLGAGKSSLLASLFRTVEPVSGELFIDGINILTLPLHTLRSRIAIVPQEPTLFQGSIRSNLDPFGTATDDMIWKALAQVKLDNHVRSLPGHTLEDKIVSEKGSNFSVGQRQLLCLARALLRQAPILVLDECTANVDHETDALIQDTVRNELNNVTVLCIAHRLHTIAYYDQIVVMDKGTVAEVGRPFELIQDSRTIFHGMCISSGDFETIFNIALHAHSK